LLDIVDRIFPSNKINIPQRLFSANHEYLPLFIDVDDTTARNRRLAVFVDVTRIPTINTFQHRFIKFIYLNKLTDVNKEVIYGKISHFITQINDDIKNSLFDILINFIKTSNNKIYIEILYLFDNDYIENNITKYYENYLKNKEWLPKSIVIEHKMIFEEQYYDTYCEYIKIKKNTLSMIKALCIILKRINKVDIINQIITLIIDDLNNKLDLNNYKHITELLLDEYAIILDFIPKQEYIDYIKCFDISKLDNSTKFKISNIVDKYK